jgi:hypothetical protein
MNKFPRFAPLLVALLFVLAFSLGGDVFAQNEAGGIQQAMTPEEFKAAGLEKLSSAELGKLNAWLQGYREKAEKKAATREKLQLVVSRVDGVIQGISVGQVIPLEDGTQWQITRVMNTPFRGNVDHPAAAAYKNFFGWKLRIAGVGEYYVIRFGKH